MKKTTQAAMKNSRRALRAVIGATPRTNGVVVWSGPSPFDGAPVALIATGIARKSRNSKTKAMVQTYIMRTDVDPLIALLAGMSGSVCGDCPMIGFLRRPTPKERRRERARLRRLAKAAGRTELLKLAERSCYVAVHQSVLSVYRAFKRGAYPIATPEQTAEIFAGRAVRLGSYGDPAWTPIDVLETIVARAASRTGYTHQWRNRPEYLRLLMGSADSQSDALEIERLGGRAFVVSADGEISATRQIVCPATTKAKMDCERCGICNGASAQPSVRIAPHGAGKRYA